jgi:acid phosphatase class B
VRDIGLLRGAFPTLVHVPTCRGIRFAAECIELAQTASSPEKHALYLKMASVWHQMAQRWEKVSD